MTRDPRSRLVTAAVVGVLAFSIGATKLGQQPFHSSYDPEGGRMLVTTNVDSMVNVIDTKTRQVVQKLPVTKAHGVSAGIIAGS